eukprot:gene14310-20292_t
MMIVLALLVSLVGWIVSLWIRSERSKKEIASTEEEVHVLIARKREVEQRAEKLSSLLAERERELQKQQKRLSTFDGILAESDEKVKHLHEQVQLKEVQRAQLQQQLRRSQKAASNMRRSHEHKPMVTPQLAVGYGESPARPACSQQTNTGTTYNFTPMHTVGFGDSPARPPSSQQTNSGATYNFTFMVGSMNLN